MKATEVLKLVTVGYSVGEINELKGMKPEALQLALNGKKLTEVKDYMSLISAEDGNLPEAEETEQGENDPEPDYKKMYEELKTKSDTMEQTIKDIQKENQGKDQQGDVKSSDELLAEIVSAFM